MEGHRFCCGLRALARSLSLGVQASKPPRSVLPTGVVHRVWRTWREGDFWVLFFNSRGVRLRGLQSQSMSGENNAQGQLGLSGDLDLDKKGKTKDLRDREKLISQGGR